MSGASEPLLAANGKSHGDSDPEAINHRNPAATNSTQASTTYYVVCLIGYSLSFIIFGSQVSILGPTIKPLAQRLGVDETDLSPLFTALGVSCIVSGTPSGWVVDRVPTHTVLIVSLLVEAIGFSLVPYMPDVWSLTALYFVICFSYNFTNSAVFTSLGWMFPKRAGGALNLVLAMFGVGSFFIPLAAELSKQYLGSALAVFWLVGALSAASTLPLLFVTSPSKPQPDGEGLLLVKHKDSRLLEAITTVAVVSLVFFTTAAETSIGNWIYTFSYRELELEDSDAALANSMFWGAFTVGRVVGVLVSPLTTPAILLLGSTPFCIVGAALPILMRGSMTWELVMATALLTGFGNATGYANAVALLEQYVPVTGFINGVFGAVAGAACMVGPTLVAMMAKYTSLGYYSMAWVGLFFYALHVPAIVITMIAGRGALAAVETAARDAAEEEAATATSTPRREDRTPVKEPLMSPRQGQGQQGQEDGASTPTFTHHIVHPAAESFPVRIERSYSHDLSAPRVSLPGHFPASYAGHGSGSRLTPGLLLGASHGAVGGLYAPSTSPGP